ncbi:LysR family transcriptional regulator [Paracoccus albus]|uniref:LysR substrate-binding domain-containing protein n=1 Tax=Paracoccus albus TaxID=3017784 RepID=UPI0022F1435D|nr:LysR family transcriptional regulator [Paracoccus albus]WBU61671.1 LysR substrate-binding domain-containing protein [Paracoccus albus]
MLALRHYELLVTLSEELHFGRAAERLGISQPQLTLVLKQMEELVGATLFERNRRNVSLSATGALLLPEARAVLRHAARAENVALRAGQGVIGELAIGYIGAASYNGVLTKLLSSYRQVAPDTRLRLTLMDLDQQIPEVEAGNLDAGIVRLPYPNRPESLTFRTLRQERLWIALPLGHGWAGAVDGVALSDLAGEAFIGTHLPSNSGFSASMHQACANAGVIPDIVHRAPQFAAIVSLVAAGLGVAIVPESIRHLSIPGVVYHPLKGTEVTANISLVYRTETENPSLEVLLSCLEEVVF